MKTIFFLTIALFAFACQSNRAFHKPPVTFSELWKADTCGTKGYRDFVVQYIDNVDDNKFPVSILEGRSLKYVEHHFGKPDEEHFSKEWNSIHYWYYCSAPVGKKDGKCADPVGYVYRINIDAKTKKVIMH